MGITATFSEPFLTSGTGSSVEVPDLYPVAIDGVGYMIDTSQQWGHETIRLLREQADGSQQPSEQTLSPEDLWRRSAESWHRGAGQEFLDRPESDPFRFRTSKGLDPWTKWQLTLLPATDAKRASVETNLQLVVAGTYLYVADGTEAYYTADVTVDSPTWTAATIQAGESATAIESLTSDGFYVYAALGSNGIHRNERGTTTSSHYSDLLATLVGYVKGRLMAAKDNALYNVTAAGAAPSALFTHPNTDFTWVGFAPGNATTGGGFIYAAGYAGDKSLIYRTAVKADGTALDAPVVAGELPDGEIVRSIAGYLGYVLIGTDKGIRFCQVSGAGDLIVGGIVGPAQPVYCFEGQDKYVWFGWDNYDATDTGLGRLDLSQFTDTELLAPAYASDLMATTQGSVRSVLTFQSRTVFTVSGVGVYAEDTAKVTSGTLDSGGITYSLSADDKVALYLDIRHEPLAGSVTVYLATDGGTFTEIGTSAVANSTEPTSSLLANQAKGQVFEIRTKLTRDSTDTTTGPTIVRETLRAFPAPPRGRTFVIPVLLHEDITLLDGQERHLDPNVELERLENLVDTGRVVSIQQGTRRDSVKVESLTWSPSHMTANRKWWNGTAVLLLKRFSQGA